MTLLALRQERPELGWAGHFEYGHEQMLFAAITNIRHVKAADPFPGNPVRLAPLRVPEEVGARLRWTAGIIVHCVVRDADVDNAGTYRPDPAAVGLDTVRLGFPWSQATRLAAVRRGGPTRCKDPGFVV